MENSKLENLPDRILFHLIKMIDNETNVDLDTYDLSSTSDEKSKLMGLGDLDYIDYNYIVSVYDLNKKLFEDDRLSAKLERPIPKLYSYEYEETKIETVVTTYRLNQTSYSKNLVRETIEMIERDGNLEWWDGREIDREYLDGETTDVRLAGNSIREVKN